jgi:16S rRNA (adenine1518-N6/adenine1519-N6)-dimethyltransferase
VPFARKRFGQHFLHDASVVARILEAVDARPGEAVVEIGPGRGVLTQRLLEAAGALDAIEIDRDLAGGLQLALGARPGFTLHVADALEFDFAALAARRGQRLRVVGNLPYNISTPLMFHLLRTPAAIADLHVMLQKEVVDRIAAEPGNGDYGRLTVMLAPWVEVESLFDVTPASFRPPPQVWSSVARLTVRTEPRFAVDARFGKVVATAFNQRRKTLRNALRTLLDAAAIESCGLDPGARPETLTPAEFGALARLLPSG